MSYAPRHGTVAYRALAHLETIRTQERTASQIAEALGGSTTGSEVASSLAPAVSAGVVFRRQKSTTDPRAPFWYSLTNHGHPVPRADAEPGVGWMNPQKDNVPTFRGRATDTPAPASQQVLKADAARRDATDRETPAHASPGVGPMGAGQPADAGPVETLHPEGDQPCLEHGREVMEPKACESADGRGSNAAPALAALPALSAAQQEAPPNPGSVEPAAPPAAPPLPPLVREEPREVDAQFAATIDAALADPEMRFALWDDGHLICMVNGAIAWRCNPEQTNRLRALLGGW